MLRLAMVTALSLASGPATAGDAVWLQFSGELQNNAGTMTYQASWHPVDGIETRLREQEQSTRTTAGSGAQLRLTTNTGKQVYHQVSVLGGEPAGDVAGVSTDVPKRGGLLMPVVVRSGPDIGAIELLLDGKRVWGMTPPKSGPSITSLTARVEFDKAVFRWTSEPKGARAAVMCESETTMRELAGEDKPWRGRVNVPVSNIETTKKKVPCRVLVSDGFRAVSKAVTLNLPAPTVEAHDFSDDAYTIPVGGGGGTRRSGRSSGTTSSKVSDPGIAAVIRDRRPALERCVERVRLKDKSAGGRVTLRWWITNSGHVRMAVVISSPASLKPAIGCMIGTIRNARFPRHPKKDKKVTHTFEF